MKEHQMAPTRRSAVKGAAWSVPALATALSVPAASASTGTLIFLSPLPSQFVAGNELGENGREFPQIQAQALDADGNLVTTPLTFTFSVNNTALMGYTTLPMEPSDPVNGPFLPTVTSVSSSGTATDVGPGSPNSQFMLYARDNGLVDITVSVPGYNDLVHTVELLDPPVVPNYSMTLNASYDSSGNIILSGTLTNNDQVNPIDSVDFGLPFISLSAVCNNTSNNVGAQSSGSTTFPALSNVQPGATVNLGPITLQPATPGAYTAPYWRTVIIGFIQSDSRNDVVASNTVLDVTAQDTIEVYTPQFNNPNYVTGACIP